MIQSKTKLIIFFDRQAVCIGKKCSKAAFLTNEFLLVIDKDSGKQSSTAIFGIDFTF